MSCKNTFLSPAWLLLSLGFPLSQICFADEGNRASYCQVESSAPNWPTLNSQCDIGRGLWGRTPKQESSSFWLQCYYGKILPNKAITATIKGLYPNNSYLAPDGDNYRCLIGPFQHYHQAQSALDNLARHQLDQTFIRQTSSMVTISTNTGGKAPADTTATKTGERQRLLVENRVVQNAVIYSFTFKNLNYHLPRNINSTADMPPAFTREHDQYWSKVNFLPAESWCTRHGLRLPTISELKDLQTNGQHLLLRHRWPIQSSYWSSTINPYSGEIETLNLRNGRADEYRPLAQLYTTCVSEAN